MDLPLLVRAIQASRFLLESEKAYWLKTLPTMNDAQIAELSEILEQSAQIPGDELEKALPIIDKAVKSLS